MAERDRTRPDGIRAKDVETAVLSATTAVFNNEKLTWKLVGGTDIDGDALTVVVAVRDDGVLVVTLLE